MAGHGEKFGRKQEDAIAALLTQRNVEEAARTAGIGARTLLRWLKLPEFQDAYRQARREAFSQSIARLQQGIDVPRGSESRILRGQPAATLARSVFSIPDGSPCARNAGWRDSNVGRDLMELKCARNHTVDAATTTRTIYAQKLSCAIIGTHAVAPVLLAPISNSRVRMMRSAMLRQPA
jgi:transposase-like protein